MLLGAPVVAFAASGSGDQDLAAQATLGLSDFPADGSWDGRALEGADQTTQDNQDAALSAFPECATLRAAYRDLYAAPYAASLYTFKGESVADIAVVFKERRVATRFAAAYRNPKTAACFRKYWTSLYDESANAKVAVVKLPGTITAGGTTGVRLKSEYLLNGTPTLTYFDFLTVTQGRGAGTFTFASNDTPFPEKLQKQLLRKVAGRLPR